MNRAISIFMLLSILVTSCKPTSRTSEVRGFVEKEGGAVVEGPSGLWITIPPDGLYEDIELQVDQVEPPEAADAQTFLLPEETVFEITATGDGVFRLPVEIVIPYSPTQIPDNRSEADVFPVFYSDGTWFRTEGWVDKEANVLHVYTLHNGFWSWAVDPIVENWPEGPKHDFFCEQGQDLEMLAKARALMRDRNEELKWVLEDAKFRVEEAKAPTEDILNFAINLLETGYAEAWSISHGSALASQVGGKAAVISIEGTKVGSWIIGGLESGLTLYTYGLGAVVIYKEAYAIGDVSAQIYRIDQAYKRWKEAEALVKVLEDGCTVRNLPPDLAQALDKYVEILAAEETTGVPTSLDFTASAYEDPRDVEVAVAESGMSDFDKALSQAMLAAETGYARDWYPLMDPGLDEEARKQAAREMAKLLEPYTLSCLSYHRSATGNFTDGALLIYKAVSTNGTGDKIYRFTFGIPPDSSIYRYASYFEPWQDWDAAYWDSVKGQGQACPGGSMIVEPPEVTEYDSNAHTFAQHIIKLMESENAEALGAYSQGRTIVHTNEWGLHHGGLIDQPTPEDFLRDVFERSSPKCVGYSVYEYQENNPSIDLYYSDMVSSYHVVEDYPYLTMSFTFISEGESSIEGISGWWLSMMLGDPDSYFPASYGDNYFCTGPNGSDELRITEPSERAVFGECFNPCGTACGDVMLAYLWPIDLKWTPVPGAVKYDIISENLEGCDRDDVRLQQQDSQCWYDSERCITEKTSGVSCTGTWRITVQAVGYNDEILSSDSVVVVTNYGEKGYCP